MSTWEKVFLLIFIFLSSVALHTIIDTYRRLIRMHADLFEEIEKLKKELKSDQLNYFLALKNDPPKIKNPFWDGK